MTMSYNEMERGGGGRTSLPEDDEWTISLRSIVLCFIAPNLDAANRGTPGRGEETVARWIAKTTRIKVRRVQGRIAARRERLLRINAATPRHTLRLFGLACIPSC